MSGPGVIASSRARPAKAIRVVSKMPTGGPSSVEAVEAGVAEPSLAHQGLELDLVGFIHGGPEAGWTGRLGARVGGQGLEAHQNSLQDPEGHLGVLLEEGPEVAVGEPHHPE